ncbi:MAG: alpha/beta hydrolase [Flavobacteriaceae bacterium]|nr:MAG: alpha/beta hydrolase [Flavobacteriaceae bacterium]
MIHGPLYEAWIQKRDLPFIMIVPQMHMFGRDSIAKYIAARTPNDIPKRLENGTPERPGYFSIFGEMTGAIPSDSIPNWITTDAGWDRQEQDLLNMLDNTLANFNADKNRVYLSGLSYGGFGTWYMGSKHADRFAAINPIVGFGHPDLMQAIVDEQLPVWAFAGGRDTAVETQYFFTGMNKLEELGHKDIRFTIHEDMGHDAWKRIYGGQDIYDWFLQYSK